MLVDVNALKKELNSCFYNKSENDLWDHEFLDWFEYIDLISFDDEFLEWVEYFDLISKHFNKSQINNNDFNKLFRGGFSLRKTKKIDRRHIDIYKL